jgi:tetrapyrrole methylase family protein/MazG family protein
MAGPFEELLQTIDTLRAPGGCPWDRKQTLLSAARYLMDEAGELVESALEGDDDGCREELADLLFMVSFCTRILSEKQPVTMHDIAREGNAKLIRRHPHVFGDAEAREVGASQELWNAMKAEEKRAKGLDTDAESALKSMPAATAPLHVAYRMQDDAADVGFDWPAVDGVWDKLHEELDEVRGAVDAGDAGAIEHEIGDLLFSVVNLARWHKVQPDMALRLANNRFRDRFHEVESEFRAAGRDMKRAGIDDLEAAWQRAKRKLADPS